MTRTAKFWRALLLVGALALAGPGEAKPAGHGDKLPSGPKAFVGTWRMGHDGEGATTCVIRFDASGVIGGFRLEPSKHCRGAVDRYDDLYAWRLNPAGELVLADPTRQGVYRLHRIAEGIWATEGADDERYLLQRTAARAHR